ncbi:MAG: polysaccharide biosynthesis protein, partial [Bacteroidales bacterium]|nr:polysaccharide biosynthesis protein [Bacteroidales bacterium]
MGIIIRQSVKGTVVSYVGAAIGFITTFFVLTNFLTAEEIGLTRVLVDAATVFAGLAQLGTTSSAIRYFPYFKDGEKDKGFFFWTLVVPFVGFLIYSLFFWLLKEPISGVFAKNSSLFVD